ncbi:FMN cyclase-like isoform X1 [Octopus vulgaris]|uniref:Triokinase/FMN cyclase n=1 Tax=Octopus vulgaris TaxID=6645 RepID=A0AA36FAY6_OCTVU|nr:FMN cyclase-like isoform X1 [Octopus vulgaris]
MATNIYFLNCFDTCVDDHLAGQVSVHPGQRLLEGPHRVVVRADVKKVIEQGKVTLLCGGGSGHEPAFAGYVGEGLLSASVSGPVFTSPPPMSISAAINAICTPESKGGCLLLLLNYTGDRLNFGLSLESCRSQWPKVSLDSIIIGEDCASTSNTRSAGRRGLCGSILVMKIAGAMAEEGRSLAEITTVCRDVLKCICTIGLSLSGCTVPGVGPLFSLEAGEMELGLGLHGEAGVKRLKFSSAKDAVTVMLDHMFNPDNCNGFRARSGEEVACIINNLGGLTTIELNTIAKETIKYLEYNKSLCVSRVYCGTFITSLNMRGVSVTLLHLNKTYKKYLDAPTTAPSWPRSYLPVGTTDRLTPTTVNVQTNTFTEKPKMTNTSAVKHVARHELLKRVCESLLGNEEYLNQLDTVCGDGDCGSTLARGAQVVIERLNTVQQCYLAVDNWTNLAEDLAEIAKNCMGGTSGAIYCLFFTAAARELEQQSSDVTGAGWCKALGAGLETIQRYSGANPGDRTMVDPLHSAYEMFGKTLKEKDLVSSFRLAVEAAESGAEATKSMSAQAGRASYVSSELLDRPDPGAVGVALWLRAILDNL